MATTGDHQFAHDLAEEAGRLLLDLRAELVAQGVDPKELKAEGDRRSHELIMRRLQEERPDDAVLSEEGEGEEGRQGTDRLGAARVWVVDPLGTREFASTPRRLGGPHRTGRDGSYRQRSPCPRRAGPCRPWPRARCRRRRGRRPG